MRKMLAKMVAFDSVGDMSQVCFTACTLELSRRREDHKLDKTAEIFLGEVGRFLVVASKASSPGLLRG